MLNRKEKIDHLFKTNPVEGNFCHLHHVTADDAEFIFDLRTKRKDSFLKPTSGGVEDQKNYLKSYLSKLPEQKEIYYKIFDPKAQKFCGVLRLTEINEDKIFNWQSFVVSEAASPNATIDAMLMTYRIGFEYLERTECGPWEVDKEFVKMMKIHDFIKMAKIVDQNEKYYWVMVKKPDYDNNINKFLKMGYGGLKGLL